MAEQTSVVTPQRFEQGFTYPDYIAQIKINKARFEGFYDNFQVRPEEAAGLKSRRKDRMVRPRCWFWERTGAGM